MSRAPKIDGQIAPGEWNDAKSVDLGAGVTLWIGNDARTLYLAALDSVDLSFDIGNSVNLVFDDEGGPSPVLDDGAWTNPSCLLTSGLGEGILDFTWPSVGFYEKRQDGFTCVGYAISDRISFDAAAPPGGVTYEIAIPLDGPSPLRAGPGEKVGVSIAIYRDSAPVAYLPSLSSNPADFRNLSLASGGCNSGPRALDVFLPLDWEIGIGEGTGQGWIQSKVEHEPELCLANTTGGSGTSVCVANGAYTSTDASAYIKVPLSLAGQSTATIRFRASLVQGTPGVDLIDLTIRQQSGYNNEFLWQEDHAGEPAEVQLDLSSAPYLGDPPLEMLFGHYTTAGGIEGGYAQIDDVELQCGPSLFADGFESRLTTHWSATIP